MNIKTFFNLKINIRMYKEILYENTVNMNDLHKITIIIGVMVFNTLLKRMKLD